MGLRSFLPNPFPKGPRKGRMRFKNKGWLFWGASLLIHLCLVHLISLLPPGQGLSLKNPGENLYNVRILGLKGSSKVVKKRVHSLATMEKKRAEEKTVMGKTYAPILLKEIKGSKVQKVKPSPTSSPSTHEKEKVLVHESRPLTPEPPMERKAIPVAWEPKGSGFQTNSGKGGEGTGGLIPPVPIQMGKPSYPPLARRSGYQGRLILRFLVSREGKVTRIKVVRSSGYSILDRVAIKTVRHWRFSPASRKGRPIPFWMEVPVVFDLREGKGS